MRFRCLSYRREARALASLRMSAHMRRLARAFGARIQEVLVLIKAQTKSKTFRFAGNVSMGG